ncbi:hypothetical protein FF100_04060 [Methylobacterium terricola]|uniref:Uncharacterized protein n=1 Tax=Methylobacterium terricola TaxID=2583531 RepID=A0A5C4LPR5_9HYPH|nr:hypothetical protein [Methylobacterium terricola]TNC16428.1 hypothetical protein FF100_04060 [Methylobacterium terricola]
MSLADLRRRLERVEAIHVVEAPRAILADRPMGDEEGVAALRDWRRWTADGRASLHRGILYIVEPRSPTEAEWAADHLQRH